ncbi:glycosyl transferase, group 1 [Alcanivorax balearicus MACL04]|uniref:Glycosyl transferase, group 1 n=1 Tax=Alloalcanivorax balearicus MACL04 TaxID=1177182 RepID=A0ABT2R127_9GAMM|nr:glycosyl transferase, group 1 [Alloalcanivorax balearicus MACL04]
MIGYVGALSSYYCIDNLIGAARVLKDHQDVHFRIVGGGEDLGKLKNLAFQYGLENISFTGKVSKDKVVEELERFDACYVGLKEVKANLYGISCNKIFEYMYAAKPIVASYITNYDPVQMAGCGVTIRSGTPEQLGEAILNLKENPELARDMGKKGREFFDQNHDFKLIAGRYNELLSSLISRRNNA